MNMPKSRDIQAKMPSPKVILNAFWLVTVKVLNSYIVERKEKKARDCIAEPARIRLLFTGNIPRGVLCERRSQKTRDIWHEFMRLA